MENSKIYMVCQSSRKNNSIKDYYDWKVWLEDAEKPISEIKEVDYLLHSTFKNRLRKEKDPSTNFAISSSGWGELMIQVIITEKTGKTIHLQHWLTLEDDGILKNAEQDFENKKIYLSYSGPDIKVAKKVESSLLDNGVEVLSSFNLSPELSVQEHINDAIENSDAVIAINNQGLLSEWQKEEIDIAESKAKAIIPFEDLSEFFENQDKAFPYRFKNRGLLNATINNFKS